MDYLLKAKAPAKINLRLKVLGRRSNGYHDLSMVNVACDLCDELTVKFSRGKALVSELTVLDAEGHAMPELADPSNNLASRAILQALELFQLNFSAEVELVKRIPVGAGLGGGSSDGAAGLRIVQKLAGLEGKEIASYAESIKEIATKLGADIPYLLNPVPALVEGIGEQIYPLPENSFTDLAAIIVSVPAQLSTAAVFGRVGASLIDESKEGSLKRGLEPAFTDALEGCHSGLPTSGQTLRSLRDLRFFENDLERPALELCPTLATLLDRLRELDSAQTVTFMTGSGSALVVLSHAEPRSQLIDQLSGISKDFSGKVLPSEVVIGDELTSLVAITGGRVNNKQLRLA